MDNIYFLFTDKLLGITSFISIVVFQIIYILFQWGANRRKEYLYYMAYMITIIVYALTQFEYVLPFPVFSEILPDQFYYTRHSVAFIAVFFYYRFSRLFLNLPENRPALNNWVCKLEYFILGYGILSPIMISAGMSYETEDLIFIVVCSLVLLSTAVIIVRFLEKSIPLTRYAMAGASCIALGSIFMIIIIQLQEAGYDIKIEPFVPLLFFTVLELLTFTTGLSYKTLLLEQEKISFERKLFEELNEKQKLALRLQSIRNNIADELHDEIGSSLSNISVFSKMARKEISDDPSRAEMVLDRIENASSKILDTMSDVVWSIQPLNDKSENTVNRMIDFAHNILTIQDIAVDFHVTGSDETYRLNMDSRKHIYLIYKEAITNIAKYSGATQVDVSFQLDHHHFILEIRDNGKGFDLQSVKPGNGSRTMRDRADAIGGTLEINSSPGNGARIRLETKINNIVD